MKSSFLHTNFTVLNLEKSIAFYNEALGLSEIKRYTPEDGSFTIVFLGDNLTTYNLELTWYRDRLEPYNLGDNEIHIALKVDNKEEAYKLHQEMACICYENTDMGLYFIADPDGYWIEVL